MKKKIVLLMSILVIIACKKPYNPAVISAPNHYLVVEGFINSGADSTFITLSRTVNLSSKTTLNPELNAVVTVDDETNLSYPLTEVGNGKYSGGPLNLDAGKKFRLHIKTNDGREYGSDFDFPKNPPDIDSISYKVMNGGIQFYVNTHDPQNNTRYYRWEFEETWKYVSFHRSIYKLVNGYPTYRVAYNDADNIYECYKTENSVHILTGSSAKLSNDVISMQPIDFVTATSGKISAGYSILLKQYAITANAYAYLEDLKKNTETLGSIFDAQPSSLAGNLHCITNPAEPVIGFISISGFKSERIFVDPFYIDLYTPSYSAPPSADECVPGEIFVAPESTFQDRLNMVFGSGDTVIINADQPRGAPKIIGYTYAPKECVDCRVKPPYGVNVKPTYWPY